jgi:hypothetical protein
MATIARGTKSSAGGGTAFVANTDALASELNTDFDTAYSAINGNLDNDNIASGAAIETSKIDGYSDSATERTTETTPGVTGSVSDASTLAGELERLRYKIKELGLGSSVKRLDGTAGVDLISWIDTPARGPNLIRNGNFAVKTTSAGSAPDGWALVGTPGTCTTTTAGKTEGEESARAIRIAASGAANEGISQTLVGLKASTKYQVGCRGKVNTAGDILGLVTTGADGATFGNLSLQTSSTSYTTLSGVIVTDSTPTNIVVQLLAVADGDSVDVTHVWVRECSTDPLPLSDSAWAVNTVTTSSADHYSDGAFVNSGVSVSIVVPGPGYVIEVHGKADVGASGTSVNGVFKLDEDEDSGGGVDRDYDYVYLDGTAAREKATARLFYVNTNPTPGATYTYRIYGAGGGDTLDRNPGSPLAGETASTTIRVRAYLESGGN